MSAAFLSTYPVRGTTEILQNALHVFHISIHVPRAGYDWARMSTGRQIGVFLSTYPVRGTTAGFANSAVLNKLFLSTYPVRGTTLHRHSIRAGGRISIHVPRAGYDTECQRRIGPAKISIHVPRAGYDARWGACSHPHGYFYPRTPCGVRLPRRFTLNLRKSFLSTYPVRGTTAPQSGHVLYITYFYPRTPCGVRLRNQCSGFSGLQLFLSTYPVRGTTAAYAAMNPHKKYFYPRTPCGVRLTCHCRDCMALSISIHVPRAGYDVRLILRCGCCRNFYPRTPCGVRPYCISRFSISSIFLSTYPVRGTTAKCDKSNNMFCILA